MTKREAEQIIKEQAKKDKQYTTYVESSEDRDTFLRQCKRAVNKMQGIPDASVNEEFFSMYATEQANRYFDREIKNQYINADTEYGKEIWNEYESIKEMTNWEYLRKYGELSVHGGWYCVDFEFGTIVFAGLSQRAMVEMGVFTNEDCKLYLDALDVIDRQHIE